MAQAPPGIVLNAPSAEDVVLLYFATRDTPPPIDTWRAADPTVRGADEFHRAQATADFDRRIAERLAALKNVRGVRVRLLSSFSHYDARNQCYYLEGLSAGSRVPFSAFGMQVALSPIDGEAATIWKTAPAEAETILRTNANSRSLTLVYTLAVLDGQRSYPANNEIAVSVQSAEILGADGRTRLGTIKP